MYLNASRSNLCESFLTADDDFELKVISGFIPLSKENSSSAFALLPVGVCWVMNSLRDDSYYSDLTSSLNVISGGTSDIVGYSISYSWQYFPIGSGRLILTISGFFSSTSTSFSTIGD